MDPEKPDLSALIYEQLDRRESDDGDTGDEPAAAGPPSALGDRPSAGDAPEAESAPAGDDDDWFADPSEPSTEHPAPSTDLFRWDELPDDPAIQKLAKGLQGTATRKYQELAEERKALEAERQRLARYQEYEQRVQQDPQAAAAMLRAELDRLSGAPSTQHGAPSTDPFESVEPETPTEQLLLQVVREMRGEFTSLKQQQAQERQRQEQQEAIRQIEGEKAGLEETFGRKISKDKDDEVRRHAVQNGIPSYKAAFWDLYGPEIVKQAKQAGAKHAQETLSRKSLQSAMPAGAPPRTGGEPRPPKDTRGNVLMALDEFDIR